MYLVGGLLILPLGAYAGFGAPGSITPHLSLVDTPLVQYVQWNKSRVAGRWEYGLNSGNMEQEGQGNSVLDIQTGGRERTGRWPRLGGVFE